MNTHRKEEQERRVFYESEWNEGKKRERQGGSSKSWNVQVLYQHNQITRNAGEGASGMKPFAKSDNITHLWKNWRGDCNIYS